MGYLCCYWSVVFKFIEKISSDNSTISLIYDMFSFIQVDYFLVKTCYRVPSCYRGRKRKADNLNYGRCTGKSGTYQLLDCRIFGWSYKCYMFGFYAADLASVLSFMCLVDLFKLQMLCVSECFCISSKVLGVNSCSYSSLIQVLGVFR